MRFCAVIRDPRSADIRFNYEPEAVDLIKRTVPPAFRTYAPSTRTWCVDEPYVDRALAVLGRHFGSVDITDQRTPAIGADWATALRDQLPEPLRQPVYRALLRVVHPDAGGDTELTKQLNNAFRPGR